jgi:hypothetical protein
MKSIFKKSKKSPIKLAGYDYIGNHPDYEDVFYYIRSIGNDNYDFMEAKLAKNKRKYELTAGTSVKVIDSFMYDCIKAYLEGTTFESRQDFIEYVYDNSFSNSELSKEEFVDKYNVKVPSDITKMEAFKEAKKEGFSVLYCGRSLQEKKFETYSIVLVKKEEFDFFGMKREYTRFKPILYMTKPSYVKKQGVEQFAEFPQSDLNIIHDILNK